MFSSNFKNSYDTFLQYIMFVMMIAMAVTVVVGVIFRWSGHALVWYDEVASVQLAWLTYYGSAYAALKGAHIGVPNIIKSFPLGLRKILWVVSKIIIYGFFILLAYYGFKSINAHTRRNISNLRMGSTNTCAIGNTNRIFALYALRNFKTKRRL